jgi:hypothetical protein
VSAITAAAAAHPAVLRVSLEAKATVKGGPCSRGGQRRVPVQAADHDVQPAATVTPVGRFLPQSEELFLYHVTSKVTSACLVEGLTHWGEPARERDAHRSMLGLNRDHGPEKHSHRTQFMAGLVGFVARFGVAVRLAYSPPDHSNYKAIERCWGTLDMHGHGALLDSLHAVVAYSASRTWKGRHPAVDVVTTAYQRGVTLTKEALAAVEAQIDRLPRLAKWFLDIL